MTDTDTSDFISLIYSASLLYIWRNLNLFFLKKQTKRLKTSLSATLSSCRWEQQQQLKEKQPITGNIHFNFLYSLVFKGGYFEILFIGFLFVTWPRWSKNLLLLANLVHLVIQNWKQKLLVGLEWEDFEIAKLAQWILLW